MMNADLNHYKSAVVSLVITLVITLTEATSDVSNSDDRVLRADVKTLTFYKGRMTTYRKASPMPQLTCVGGTAQCKVTPETVQCVNKGSDGSKFQVECKASMARGYSLGRVNVLCEGYESPNDPYILKGSCRLEYSVEVTGGGSHPHKHIDEKDKKYVVGGFIALIGLALLVCLLISVCKSKSSQPFTPTYVQGPPPPYGGYGAPAYGPPPGYGYQGGGGGGGIGGGGFMTGAATGGLLGYMAGRSNVFGGDNRCDSGGWGGGGGICDSSEPGFSDMVETTAFGEMS